MPGRQDVVLFYGKLRLKKSPSEITAIPQLLKLLEVSGCIITIDAMGCQKQIAKTIIKKGADYLFSLKGSMKTKRLMAGWETSYLEKVIGKK